MRKWLAIACFAFVLVYQQYEFGPFATWQECQGYAQAYHIFGYCKMI